MLKYSAVLSIAVAVSMASALSEAKVSPEEADHLGKDLTCVGAEAAGNAAGTIPPYTRKYVGEVPGWTAPTHSGAHPVDPYKDEKPILVITAANAKEHSENLTAGQLAMFERYPETFKINVYTSHRDFAYPETVCERAKWNATNAEIVDDGMGYTGLGNTPFPIPKSAIEVLWNHQLPYRAWTEDVVRDLASVQPNGDIGWGRTHGICLSPASSPTGRPHTDDKVSSYCMNEVQLPLRESGNTSVNHEPYNYAAAPRVAWTYNTGTRRVRLAPGYGFDQPLGGSNGAMTIDSDRLFNGSPERYDWELIGKKEIFIPANGYKVNTKDVTYASLLTPHHANPDYMRYELRRVWVIKAKLKEGSRHLYRERVMYLDEDTWHAVIADFYDNRGKLWKHSFVNYYYHPDMSAWQAGASFYHDLSSGQYVGYTLVQEREKGPIINKGGYEPSFFTPDMLRARGR
ncbi:DUF1329 domain-containing protein [Pseudomonas marincola]|uniref:DUF1329 domain-containing protein n=1 Tax=Pseudomonas marincola TaxID=437900 RepID=UPI0008EC4CB8|nr:DUF1329 domain-containing protein [Pseudomonas marincola]SFU14033.1 Protein of unknown function [Pseudomonas marincola]